MLVLDFYNARFTNLLEVSELSITIEAFLKVCDAFFIGPGDGDDCDINYCTNSLIPFPTRLHAGSSNSLEGFMYNYKTFLGCNK